MGKALEKIELRKILQENEDIDAVMSTPQGRRFVWRLLKYCGIYQDISVSETNEVMKKLGKRQAGLFVLGICSERPSDSVFKMMKEAEASTLQEEKEYEQADTIERGTEDTTSDGHYGITEVARGASVFI